MSKWQTNGAGNMGPFGPLSLKGQAHINGLPTFIKQLPITTGGIAGEDIPFGRVVSVKQSDPYHFLLGHPSGSIVRGIAIFEPSVAVADPGKPDYEFVGRPMTVMTLGFVDVLDFAGANAPALGGQLCFRTSDGMLGFIAPGASPTVPAGFESIGGSVYEVLDPNGAKCFFDFISKPATTVASDALTTVATPTITVTGTTMPKTVKIATTTEGCQIRYTLDGTAPDTITGEIYAKEFTVEAACTVKAVAFRVGYNPSTVASASITA